MEEDGNQNKAVDKYLESCLGHGVANFHPKLVGLAVEFLFIVVAACGEARREESVFVWNSAKMVFTPIRSAKKKPKNYKYALPT